MSNSKETIDTFEPKVRFYKGQKKTDPGVAPWSGSTFEKEYERQHKNSEYTGVFHAIEKDCRQKPLIPVSETRDWMIGNTKDQMDLTTTNASTFQSHPKQASVKTQPRRDHTSTFLDKEQAMKGCSTYTRSYVEKPDAIRPPAFKPGPPENFIALESDLRLPNSVNWETYRKYDAAEQRSAKRKPIILSPEYATGVSSTSEPEHFSTSYIDDFQQHHKHTRAIPLRPEENGIHYDLTSKCELSTTHDRAFNSNRFPAKRIVQRNEPVGGPYQPVSTMMSDFKVKTINDPAKPFQPPVGLRGTFGDDKAGYVTGYQQAFVSPDLKKLEPVINCKPVHQYKQPIEKMECQSTAHTHFTGKSCPPAASCKPKRTVKNHEDMNFNTEYNERYLQGSLDDTSKDNSD